MKRSLLSIATASVFLASVGMASADSTTSTSTTWTTDQGTAIRNYSTTQHYSSFSDPNFKPNVGVVLPGTITVYPLPDSMKFPEADRYSYSIINNNPVVVERSSRTVVHSWEQ